MKKYSIIIAAILTFTLCACGVQDNKENPSSPEKSAVPAAQKEDNKTAELSYSIREESINEDNSDLERLISVKYPSVYGMKDAALQDKINNIIKQQPVLGAEYEGEPGVTYDISYEVFSDNSPLSVVYTGYYDLKGAVHPTNVFASINIDTKTGERLRLDDLVKDKNAVLELFSQGLFVPVQEEVSDVLDEMLPQFLETLMQNIDSFDTDEGCYSYVTRDSLGISLPVIHALGDHVEFEIPLLVVSQYISFNITD